MIPTFPQFKRICATDRAQVEAYTRRHAPYSDFNFTNLWTWDANTARMISDLNGNLVVRHADYATREPFFSFLGTNKGESTATDLAHFAAAAGISPVLRLMPEDSTAGLSSSWSIEEDRSNFDYIYAAEEIARLTGSRRTQATRCLREFPSLQFRFEILDVPHVRSGVCAVLRRWEANKKMAGKAFNLGCEKSAICRLLGESDNKSLFAASISNGEEMIAFDLLETLPQGYAVSHFAKADVSYVGATEFLNIATAARLIEEGVTHINWAQDLGLEGLRRSKLSYRPIRFLKKYRVQLRDGSFGANAAGRSARER